MKEYLALVRWKNLVMVILTMFLMRYAVISPLLGRMTIMPANGSSEVAMTVQMPVIDFILLVFATVLITAGGYVINDYFDIRTDLINRGKVIVGTRIPRRQAILWHSILNIAGVITGFYLSWKAGYLMMGALFLLVSGLLYFYSASYKKQFLVGNIIVAILTAMVPVLVALFEWPSLYRYYYVHAAQMPDIDFILYWTGGFALFAFLSTLAREIIKDIEDFEGDTAYGSNTVPIVIGILPAKIVSVSLVMVIVVLLYVAWYFFIRDVITLAYLSLLVVVPLLLVIYTLVTGNSRKQLHLASSLMKVSMLTGLLYAVVVRIILTWNLY